MIVLLASFLAGVLLGTRSTVYVLIPATVVVVVVVTSIQIAQQSAFADAVLAVLAAAVAIQTGYFFAGLFSVVFRTESPEQKEA